MEKPNLLFSPIIGYGKRGICFLKHDQVIKLYYNKCLPNSQKSDMLHELVTYDNDCFIYPNELIYDENGNIIGYTSDYVDSRKIRWMSGNAEESLDDYERLVKSVKRLSDNKIIIRDLCKCNAYYNGKYSIIDLEEYEKEDIKRAYSSVFDTNIRKVTDLILMSMLGIKETDMFSFNSELLRELYKQITTDYSNYCELIERMCSKYGTSDIRTLRRKNIVECKYNDYNNKYLL